MTKTYKLTLIGILSTLSFVLMIFNFPLIPGADFLKMDFSIVPILLGLVLLDSKGAYAIIILRSVLKLIILNEGPNTYIGLPMNIAAMAVFVLAFSLIWRERRTKLNYVLAGIAGTLGLTAVMVLLNYVYAVPLYAAFAGFDIAKTIGLPVYLFGMVVPFNLIQGLVFSLSFALAYAAVLPILKLYKDRLYEK